MRNKTRIRIDKDTLADLKKLKEYKHISVGNRLSYRLQSYSDVLKWLLKKHKAELIKERGGES